MAGGGTRQAPGLAPVLKQPGGPWANTCPQLGTIRYTGLGPCPRQPKAAATQPLLLWPSGSSTQEGTGTVRSPPLSRRHRACIQTQCAENSSRIPAPKDTSLTPLFPHKSEEKIILRSEI